MADYPNNRIGPGKQLPSGVYSGTVYEDEESDDGSSSNNNNNNKHVLSLSKIITNKSSSNNNNTNTNTNDPNSNINSIDSNGDSDDDGEGESEDDNDNGINNSTISILTNQIVPNDSTNQIEYENHYNKDIENVQDIVNGGGTVNCSSNNWYYPDVPFAVRSAAIEHIRYRGIIQYQSCTSKKQNMTTMKKKKHKHYVNNNLKTQFHDEMILSSNFNNIDTILLKLRRDKSSIIRKSFDIAATAVLVAIRNHMQQQQEDARVKKIKQNSVLLLSVEDEPFWQNLPECLKLNKNFERLRYESMERAHNNKEYNKRKGGKVESSTITAATMTLMSIIPQELVSSTTTTTSKGLVTSNKQIKKEEDGVSNNESKRKLKFKNDDSDDDDNDDVTMPITTKSVQMTNEVGQQVRKKRKKSGNEGSSDDDVDNDDDSTSSSTSSNEIKNNNDAQQATTTTTTTTIVPKFTRNTPASSAAALDFRFNSSRAILCVAGNIVFDALTPNFNHITKDSTKSDDNDYDNNEVVAPSIDILDVPQNPATKQIKSKPKKKRRNSRSYLVDDDDRITSDKDGSDDESTPDNHPINKDEQAETKKKKSVTIDVNMGAVKVEAQLLAQRTICVVENAIHRATLRYQYRRDNAKYQYTAIERTLPASTLTWNGETNNGTSNYICDEDDGMDIFLNVTNPFEWKASDAGVVKTKSSKKRKEDHTSVMTNGSDDDTSTEDGNDRKKDKKKYRNDSDETDSNDSDNNSRDSNESNVWNATNAVPYQPNIDSTTYVWQSVCLPRFLSVLSTGAGHAIYHDIQWSSRHGRIADLLRTLSTTVLDDGVNSRNDRRSNLSNRSTTKNFGPHLIVTTEPELVKFGQEFYDIRRHLRLVMSNESKSLHALTYHGSSKHRESLRTEYFAKANGLPEAPFHVLITTYTAFFKDYIHFCQLPFESVIVDDGVSFMATACDQNNSVMSTIWDSAMFSSNDYYVGLAGTQYKEWDYAKGNKITEASIRDAFIGLTARHRIMTASTFTMKQRQATDIVAISGLVDFIAPQFSLVVHEEWARSRIYADTASMGHFRKLVSRSVIVHDANSSTTDLYTLAEQALTGQLPSSDRSDDPHVPHVISDDDFVLSSKIAFSRRSALLWLGPPSQSWLRYELGTVDFQPIIEAMKLSTHHGHFCEEITTASSTTATGANGQVAGSMAYRCGVRCGRHFGSEPGLRQHVSALHAPPGTWLCRTCGVDCITSQARTHHERSCGQPTVGNGDIGGSVGATPTVGQGASTGKKKIPGRPGAIQPGASSAEEKDPDGSFRVPGYRGVFITKNGKHFVKINGTRLTDDKTTAGTVLLFDDSDDAARMHDSVAREVSKDEKIEYNFKTDGTRIIYEDINPASTSGLGGSAANVVPALSVINIKDLPPDVKPLLRDPRQTSRTGGNSKRHVYAYRGVCRQARKGHDRWQSQISFMGVNHYLGTFDSEWDAAAIYAWAHLILYGEEATKQAQKEGEEAAAAYEQEKRDIAAGKIPLPPQKQEKPKKKVVKKGSDEKDVGEKDKTKGRRKKNDDEKALVEKRGGRSADKGTQGGEKRKKPGPKPSRMEKELLAPLLEHAVAKASILGPREAFAGIGEHDLTAIVAQKIQAARSVTNGGAPTIVKSFLRPSITNGTHVVSQIGGAMLVGLPPSLFGWDLQDFVGSNELASEQDTLAALQLLAVEYDEDGVNEKFKAIIQGTVCIIGSALQKANETLGLGRVPVGGSCGRCDCHIGGVPGCCSDTAACIRYFPTLTSRFQFTCLSEYDVVTLNGRRLTSKSGWFPLFNEDVCVVGGRVFAFIIPSDL